MPCDFEGLVDDLPNHTLFVKLMGETLCIFKSLMNGLPKHTLFVKVMGGRDAIMLCRFESVVGDSLQHALTIH